MSQIVLGVGTSHTPLLTFDAQTWLTRAQDDLKSTTLNLPDGRFVSYTQLQAEVGDRYIEQSGLEHLSHQAERTQHGLDRLAAEIERVHPDLAIIIGDDHEEMFRLTAMPGVAVYYGAQLIMHPWKNTWPGEAPPWFAAAMRGYAMDAPHRFDGSPEFAKQLIDQLMRRGVDVAGASNIEDPETAGIGHAFGFVIHRLFGGRRIPVVPLLVNTYYAPNVVRPERCYDIGRALRRAIEAIPGNHRVMVVGSGGLSHFVTDEATDRRVLDALKSRDVESLRTLPMEALNSGSSETLCWVVAAGALEALDLSWSDYVPVYRTPAGSGIGIAFATWHPR